MRSTVSIRDVLSWLKKVEWTVVTAIIRLRKLGHRVVSRRLLDLSVNRIGSLIAIHLRLLLLEKELWGTLFIFLFNHIKYLLVLISCSECIIIRVDFGVNIVIIA